MLHTTARSLTSDSSSSLRRSRLGGISEDIEDGIPTPAQTPRSVPMSGTDAVISKGDRYLAPAQATSTLPSPLPNQEQGTISRQMIFPPRDDSLASPKPLSPPIPVSAAPSSRTSKIEEPSTSIPFDKPLPEPPEDTPLTERTIDEDEDDYLDYQARRSQEAGRTSFEHRPSSQSIRPTTGGRASTYSGYTYMPKKKLGPRPHVQAGGRPHTSGPGKKDQRPVANLPTTVRASTRPVNTNNDRPGSQHSSRSVPSNFRHRNEFASPPPLPQPVQHIVALYNPPPSKAESFISIPASVTSTKTSAVTPEKLRLMKALQMRKKQQALAKRASLASSAPDSGTHSRENSSASQNQEEQLSSTDQPQSWDSTSQSHMHEEATTRQEMGSNMPLAPLEEDPVDHASALPAKENIAPGMDTADGNVVETPAGMHSTGRGLGPKAALDGQTKPDESDGKAEKTIVSKVNGASMDSTDPHQPTFPIPPTILETPAEDTASRKDQDNLTNSIDASPSTSDISHTETPDRDRRRQGLLDPVKVLSSPEASDASDDDSFVEELRHAKLEEAKPMSVARSPITPIFKKNSDALNESARAVSSPVPNQAASTTTTPDREKARSIGGRSASTALPQWPPQNGDPAFAPLAKKGTVSSGISTRIKALETFSRRETSGSPPQTPQPVSQKPAASLWSFKKRASLAPFRKTLNTSTTALPPQEVPSFAPTPTPEPVSFPQPRPWLQRNGSETQIETPLQKGESISVTARIIRDPKDTMSNGTEDPTEPALMDLHRSPLIVEHERPEHQSRPVMSRTTSAVQSDSRPTSPREKPRFSFTSSRASMARLPTSDSMASRLSQASSTKKGGSGNMPRSASDNSSITEEKPKESRTSRLMKRMSNLAGGSRRNMMSPNGRELNQPDPIAELGESQTEMTSESDSQSHVVDIGDVNVQFPDTLLWKRRFMRIDDQGYLVLTPPTRETMERNRGVSRRFHLSEFKKPTLPDPEREELPWSILIDFEDGTCLQCACESRYAQTQVLRSTQGHSPKLSITVLTS